MGQFQTASMLGDMAQGVGALIAELGGIGKTADAHGIEDNQENAVDVDFRHSLKKLTQG
jgi:hypothetical protein